jgi:hypothetical protein
MYGACSSFSTVCAEPFGTNTSPADSSNPSEVTNSPQGFVCVYSTKGVFREQKIEVSEKIFGLGLI